MRTRRSTLTTAVMLMALLSLTGCFGRANENSGSSNSLSVWMFPQGDDDAAIRAMEAAYEKANPGKQVDVVIYPEEEYVTKVNTALVAGNPPDVAIIENDDWMKAGYVVNLTDRLAEWGVKVADYNQGGLSRGALENNPANGIYGIGTFLGGNVIVYNKAIFDAAGVPYPSADTSMTFQQYADICRKLGKPNEDPAKNVYGCSMPADIAFNFYPIYGQDGRTAEGNMNAPELAQAFEIGAGLINDGFAPSSSVLDTIQESDLFAQGQIAMTWSDFTAVPTYEEANINFGMAPFFVVQGQQDFVDTWTAPWGTFTQSKHPDEALRFLKFVATDAQKIQMSATPDPPLSSLVAQSAGYGKDDPVKEAFLGVLANARPVPFAPPGEEAWDPVEVMRLLTVEGQTDAQAILDDMASQAQANLDEVWARWDNFGKADFEAEVRAEASAQASGGE